MNPSYGPIFKMRRVGYQGKIISVFKFRTMSPYSEYVQTAIIKKNKLDKTGKINNDYRVTFYGKFLRKYWIDEFPMILNWMKRDLKIVGVRPLSEDYFKRYPKDLQDLRIKTKPGLVPPYYVDLPVSFEEICESERRYLKSYFERPIRTDFSYFLKAFYNIVIKKKKKWIVLNTKNYIYTIMKIQFVFKYIALCIFKNPYAEKSFFYFIINTFNSFHWKVKRNIDSIS